MLNNQWNYNQIHFQCGAIDCFRKWVFNFPMHIITWFATLKTIHIINLSYKLESERNGFSCGNISWNLRKKENWDEVVLIVFEIDADGRMASGMQPIILWKLCQYEA